MPHSFRPYAPADRRLDPRPLHPAPLGLASTKNLIRISCRDDAAPVFKRKETGSEREVTAITSWKVGSRAWSLLPAPGPAHSLPGGPGSRALRGPAGPAAGQRLHRILKPTLGPASQHHSQRAETAAAGPWKTAQHPEKMKLGSLYDSAIPLLGTHPKELKVSNILVHTRSFFTKAKRGERPQYLWPR